jgi:hypothetical protein
MNWPKSTFPRVATLFGAMFSVVVGLQRPAAAEDERSACATAAENAQKLRAEHKLKEARPELLVCVQPNCPSIVRWDCVQWLADVERATPSVVVKASDPASQELIDVSMWIDGVQEFSRIDGLAHPVNPGVHQFHFEATGLLPVDQQIVVREGEVRRLLTVQFPRKPVPMPSTVTVARPATSILPYVLSGVGIAALGSFTYFGLSGRADASDLESSCGVDKSCSDSQVDPVRRKLLLADVSLGVSLVSLGVAAYLFVSHHRSTSNETTSLQASAGPGMGSVSYRVTF